MSSVYYITNHFNFVKYLYSIKFTFKSIDYVVDTQHSKQSLNNDCLADVREITAMNKIVSKMSDLFYFKVAFNFC